MNYPNWQPDQVSETGLGELDYEVMQRVIRLLDKHASTHDQLKRICRELAEEATDYMTAQPVEYDEAILESIETISQWLKDGEL